MNVKSEVFGTMPSGEPIHLYTLENKNGVKAQISDLGCALVRLYVPDRNGNTVDVVLGHGDSATYLTNPGYLGIFVGRNANRIKGAAIEISGTTYALEKNDADNNLHSGSGCMGLKLFNAAAQTIDGSPALKLTCKVADMEDKFPGNLEVCCTYILTDDNALILDYYAVSDKDTVINLTNHSYFNLAGHSSGDIRGHVLQMDADFYTPNGEDSIPDGDIRSVEGTPFDFRTAKPIGKDIDADCRQLRMFGGYDHNFVLAGSGYRKIATVTESGSGRVMETWTDLPGVQLYTSNGMSHKGTPKDGAVYGDHQGFCLETQTFPDAAAMPWLKSPLYKAGEAYRSRTAYIFR